MKRVKRKIRTSPNPLFELWLKEWMEEAKKKGSDNQYCFGKALKSLKKYPFRLETGKECFILENFGSKLCMMLDKKLIDYKTSKQDAEQDGLTDPGECDRHVLSNDIEVGRASSVITSPKEKSYGAQKIDNKRKSCMDSPRRSLKYFKDSKNANPKKRSKDYLPSYRSGSYAILLTLHKNSREMTKAELEIEAKELCDISFKKSASSNSHYTAWSSMSTLLKKELVEKNGRPARFSLTAKGTELVLQLLSENSVESESSHKSSLSSINAKPPCKQYPVMSGTLDSNENSGNNPDLSCDKNLEKREIINEAFSDINIELVTEDEIVKKNLNEKNRRPNNHQPTEETFILLPNQFDIVLYVDNKEIESKQNVESDKIVKYLKKKNVNFEVKFLNVGDYLWVCRDKRNGRELVLPYIVERKRMDDLANSIRDGRFHEQKFRLKNCGLQNCIYLVEKYGKDSLRLGLPLPTIQQAMSNTKVIDGFNLKLTNNNDDSLNYLSLTTKFLTKMFKDKTLVSCYKKDLTAYNLSDDLISLMPFSDFNKDSGKMRKFTVRNMLIKQLLQFSGLSVEKAKAIVKVYPTPKSLMEALKSSSGESVIAKITCGALNRSVGSTLAKSLHQLYTLPRLT